MTPWRRRKELALEAMAQYRDARRLVDEDVTVLGEQLAELHVDTLTDVLDAAGQEDYRHALGGYDRAKTMLRDAERAEDRDAVLAIEPVLVEARFHRACVLARVAGAELPTRREPCFFNPQHLPAVADVAWTPPQGVERTIAVCPACRTRLEGGVAPDQRIVRVGDRRVPWWETGGSLPALVSHHAHVIRGSTLRTDTALAQATLNATTDRLDGGAF